MTNKQQKLKELLGRLEALQKGTSTDFDLNSLTERMIQEEVSSITKKLKSDPSLKILQKFQEQIVSLKKDFDVKPIMEAIEGVASEIRENQQSLVDDFTTKIRDVVKMIPTIPEPAEPFDPSLLESSIKELRTEIAGRKDFDPSSLQGELNAFKEQLQVIVENSIKSETEGIQDMQKKIDELRIDLLNRISQKGGGSMNQKISVGGTVMSKKYADFNLIGNISAVDNNTTKQVDITFTDSGASIGGTITGGTDGSVLFVNPAGVLAQDNPNFTYTNSTNLLTLGNPGIGTTSTDSLVLQNTTAAANGAQQWSPALHLVGQAWGTTLGTSQTQEFKIELQTVQATSPNPITHFSYQKAGGGWQTCYLFNPGTASGLNDTRFNLIHSGTTAGLGALWEMDNVLTMYFWNRQNGPISFGANNASRWTLQAAGHLVADADNTYNIGAAAATRPANVYVAGTVNIQNGSAVLSLSSLNFGGAIYTNTNFYRGVSNATFAWYNDGAAETGILLYGKTHATLLNNIDIVTGNVTSWRFQAAGHLICPTDNTIDIGASAATRPRTIYVGTSVVAPVFTGAHNGTVGATTPSSGVFTSLQTDTITNDTGLAAGTYTPTLTGVANVGASTAYACQYMRVGNTVTVSGKVDIDPTLGVSTTTQLGISLPVASNFGNDYEAGGTGCSPSIASQSGGIYADATNDRVTLDFKAADPNNTSWWFHFTYQVI